MSQLKESTVMRKSEFQETLSDTIREVLEGLSKTLNNNTQTTVRPPTFSGERTQDVVEWLDEFEQITLGLSEQTKRQLLGCAFKKSARAWFKEELKSSIDELSWEEIKQAILKRYKPNQQDYYVEQLGKLKYQEDEGQDLASFVDQRVHISRMAYPNLGEREVVRDTILAMSPKVRSYLNLMSDTTQIDKIQELKALVSRFDQKVDFPAPRDTSQVIDKTLFEELLKNAVEKLKDTHVEVAAAARRTEQPAPEKPYEPKSHQVACQCQCQVMPNEFRGQKINRQWAGPYHHQRAPYSMPYQSYQSRPYNTHRYQQSTRPYQQRYPPQQQSHPQIPMNSSRQEAQMPTRPPGPCFTCQGDHWNRDCPQRLNESGR